MLAFGIVSRLVSGAICDRIGGLRTLLLGSALQGVALLLFLPFDGLVSLYVISALFGLFQGGIVPSYAIIVREHFPAARTGALVGAVIMCTLFGMALGGWMSGKIFDLTGSYQRGVLERDRVERAQPHDRVRSSCAAHLPEKATYDPPTTRATTRPWLSSSGAPEWRSGSGSEIAIVVPSTPVTFASLRATSPLAARLAA